MKVPKFIIPAIVVIGVFVFQSLLSSMGIEIEDTSSGTIWKSI